METPRSAVSQSCSPWCIGGYSIILYIKIHNASRRHSISFEFVDWPRGMMNIQSEFKFKLPRERIYIMRSISNRLNTHFQSAQYTLTHITGNQFPRYIHVCYSSTSQQQQLKAHHACFNAPAFDFQFFFLSAFETVDHLVRKY